MSLMKMTKSFFILNNLRELNLMEKISNLMMLKYMIDKDI